MSPRAAAELTFRSLRVRNYRLFAAGQLVSLTGTWMQVVAQSWLVLRLTGSGVALGVATALQFLPTALGGMWGGLVADRFDKRRILIATQAASMILALIMATLISIGGIQLWMVYVLAFASGLVTLIDAPTRQAFVGEMVGPAEVPNAVALNSAVFNGARIVGPALAALLIAYVGLSAAFFVNAASYLAVIAGLVAMDPGALFRSARLPRGAGQLRAGARAAWRIPRLRGTLMLLAVVAIFGLNFNIVIPLMAEFTFNRGAGGYALLMSFAAAGALVGSLWAASRRRPTPASLVGTAMVFGVALLLAAVAPTVLLESIVLVVGGAAGMAFVATANSMVQLASPPEMRGRVMALYALVFLGSTPIGGPLIGWVAEELGPRAGFVLGGVATILGASAASLYRRRTARLADARPPLDARVAWMRWLSRDAC